MKHLLGFALIALAITATLVVHADDKPFDYDSKCHAANQLNQGESELLTTIEGKINDLKAIIAQEKSPTIDQQKKLDALKIQKRQVEAEQVRNSESACE